MFGNGKGLFGGGPMAAQPQQGMGKERTGPSRTQGVLGVLGDALLSMNGGRPMFLQNLMQQRQMEQAQGYRTQQGKMDREGAMQDWMAQREYERANPEPARPGTFEWFQTATPEQRATYDQYNPVIAATGAGPVPVPRASLAPPAGPVGRLTPIDAPGGGSVPPPPSFAAPTAISRQEYNALVSESSQSAVDAYLARRGIQVRN